MEKILEVKNLRISFKTNNGLVRAVRDISFTLNKGETLAIVGESGSGKSVTARAIMGIQAGNSITESGEIFYDGQDLIKIPEEDFHKLRGNKISMVFQDPFSSLNPISRVGKQLTEAMILNGKANQRDAKREFNKRIHFLTTSIGQAQAGTGGANKTAQPEPIKLKMAHLKKFAAEGSKLQKDYNTAYENIMALVTTIEGVLIDIIRSEPKVIVREIKRIAKNSEHCYHKYLISRNDSAFSGLISELKSAAQKYLGDGNSVTVKELLGKTRDVLAKAMELPEPDFFAMGYYVTYNAQAKTEADDIPKLNNVMRAYLNDNFMNVFLNDIQDGMRFSNSHSLEKKRVALNKINEKLPLFDDNGVAPEQCKQTAKELIRLVEASIDRLAVRKDSIAYTLRTGLNAAVETYLRSRRLSGKKRLSKKEAIFMASSDIDICRENIRTILIRIRDSYQSDLEQAEVIDFSDLSRQIVEILKTNASKMVYNVTKRMAKSRAISLMEEVGIPEARARYRQYPFQLSGGMRQRIVIAIALAANPEILICDEPSTALDVTIQAQILDLLKNLQKERQLSVIFITHNLGVVANVADHLAVMYAGKIVELGTVNEVFYEPSHPYTWALLASMPDLDTKEKLEAIPGTPPNMIHPPVGDAFALRNKYAMKIDFEEEPPFFDISPTHKAATWLLHPSAPKVEPPKLVTERIERMRKMEVQSNG